MLEGLEESVGATSARADQAHGEPSTAGAAVKSWRPSVVTIWHGVLLLWLVAVIGAALSAPLFHLNPLALDYEHMSSAPSAQHWLGTDNVGRDLFARAVVGARTSLAVSALSVSVALLIGGALGMIAGYFRGLVETPIVAAIDVMLAFPAIVLALGITAALGQSVTNMVIAITFIMIPAFTRLARATTVSLREREFIVAAQALGVTRRRLLVREILPNLIPPMLALALIATGTAIAIEAALSFLGLGVRVPAPSWGNMIADGQAWLQTSPWMTFVPAAFMFLTILALNVLGEALRGVLDVRESVL